MNLFKQFFILISILFLAILVFVDYPFKLGLDLKGGVSIVLDAQEVDDRIITNDDMIGVIDVIRGRINALGLTEPVIQRKGLKQIIVELPGITDIDRAIRLIGETAQLTFHTAEWVPNNIDQLTHLTPVLVLVIWTFIIFLIMAFGRVSFMNNPQDAADSKYYKNQLPTWVNRTADNYNHLYEQPVAFYAVTLTIALVNSFDSLIVKLTWAYVLIRIIHSLVQLTINIVLVRFFLFASGWLIIACVAFSQIFLN